MPIPILVDIMAWLTKPKLTLSDCVKQLQSMQAEIVAGPGKKIALIKKRDAALLRGDLQGAQAVDGEITGLETYVEMLQKQIPPLRDEIARLKADKHALDDLVFKNRYAALAKEGPAHYVAFAEWFGSIHALRQEMRAAGLRSEADQLPMPPHIALDQGAMQAGKVQPPDSLWRWADACDALFARLEKQQP